MKKFIAILFVLTLCFSLMACEKQETAATEAPTSEPVTETTTEPTESKPITPITESTPTLSNGSGCDGDTGGSSE